MTTRSSTEMRIIRNELDIRSEFAPDVFEIVEALFAC